MFNRRVVVTGIGIVSPLGLGQKNNWKRLISGESGIDTIMSFEASELTCKIGGEIPHGSFEEGNLNLNEWFDIKDQRRKSGDPYILHPIAVAKIVADDIGLGAPSISAALLHDVVEDTNYTIDDIETIHGTQIAKIVDGLTKISSLKKDKNVSLQAENFRKMLLTLNDDARVIIIKIADRLHNMQTMDVMPQHKQIKIASETLYIYAPLAHRIGMYNIKTELEDLGLKYTEPEVYNEIQQRVQENLDSQEQFIDRFIKLTKKHLRREGLSCKIEGRPKSIFSTRKKMISKNLDFDQIFDRYAIRIIYKSDPQE